MMFGFKNFCLARPPLIIFSASLLLCSIALIAVNIYVRNWDIKDPDVEMHWNELLKSLSNLDFCVSNKNNSGVLASELKDNPLLLPSGLVGTGAASNSSFVVVFIQLHIMLKPKRDLREGVTYALSALLSGKHLGIKGSMALQQMNVSFNLPSLPKLCYPAKKVSDEVNAKDINDASELFPQQRRLRQVKSVNESRVKSILDARESVTCETIRLTVCARLQASKTLLPKSLSDDVCLASLQPLTQPFVVSTLDWHQHSSSLFSLNRCHDKSIINTESVLNEDRIPHINKLDVYRISERLTAVSVFLVCIGLGICVYGAAYNTLTGPTLASAAASASASAVSTPLSAYTSPSPFSTERGVKISRFF